MKAQAYFDKNFDYFVAQFAEIIAFKTISTDPAYKEELLQGAKWVENKLRALGFEIRVVQTTSNPVIFARRIEDTKKKTVLLYGHYDVQPVEPVSDWESDPFTLTQRDNKFFARGAMDNKGQFMMHISAIEAIIKAGEKLPVNVCFMIEGDEETGSQEIDEVFKQNKDFITSDVALISDGEITGDAIPVIEAGFRGVMNVELSLYGPKEDLHSGVYGGVIANPAYELTSLIAKLYDKDYQITIPHFYDDVAEITSDEKAIFAAQTESDADILSLSGSKSLIGEKGYTTLEKKSLRPTLQVTGITSGYTGVGFKNIVPASASAKFNFRFVTDQDPAKIYENFVAFIKKHVSPHVRYEISPAVSSSEAVKIDLSSPYITNARDILTKIYGNETQIAYVGGTLPVINAVKVYMGIPILSVPLSQQDSGMHSANERLYIDNFKKGVAFSIAFLTTFA